MAVAAGARLGAAALAAHVLSQVDRLRAGLQPPVLIGGVLGTVAAVILARLLSSFLHGVSAVEPMSLAASLLALLAVGVAAAALPAWRASRMDPAAVFRRN